MTSTPVDRRKLRRSPYTTVPCRGCGISVTRRTSEVRTEVFHSAECYRRHGGAAQRRGGRPRTATSSLITCSDGVERAANVVGGYRSIYWPEHPNANLNWRVYEHVAVMAELLGRPLEPGETVHHKNGARLDNDAANLELWTRAQPAGQRVADKIEWALALVHEYEPLLSEAQRRQLAALCAEAATLPAAAS